MVDQSPVGTHRLLPAVVASLLIVALAGCGPTDAGASGQAENSGATAPSDTGQAPVLPSGWRWESYGGVEVGVPNDWAWGNGAQRLTQWCIADKKAISKPIVGRPGATTLVGCTAKDGTFKPETSLANTGYVVGLGRSKDDSKDGKKHIGQEGDRTTVQINGVEVVVQAPAELRERIVATIHPVDVDSYGCPATHSISDTPVQRPARPVDAAALKDVATVSACRYGIGPDAFQSEPRLISSTRLDGTAAAAAVKKIADAPRGGGPNRPEQCLPEVSYGQEIMVLMVRSSAGLTEIVIRYSGCDHNGIDDGKSVRSLTADAVAPFLTGSNTMTDFFSLMEVQPILRP